MGRLGGSTALGAVAFLVLGAADGVQARTPEATVFLAAKRSSREVSSFLARKAACDRLSSEDNDDPDRTATAVRSRFANKCATIDDEERRLRARYADDPSTIDALDRGGDVDDGAD